MPDYGELTGLENPSNNSWPTASGWTTFNAVRRVGDYLYLPAVGYRYDSDGSLRCRGSNGYYWSSSAIGAGAPVIDVSSGSLFVDFYSGTYWLSVRCVAVE